MNNPKFNSIGEFIVETGRLCGTVVRMVGTGYRLNPVLRETVCLSVTLANNCGP